MLPFMGAPKTRPEVLPKMSCPPEGWTEGDDEGLPDEVSDEDD